MSWALDFRHESWSEPWIQDALDERGIARVDSRTGEAAFRYIRLREPPYDERALTAIDEEIRPLLAQGVDIYAYFRHEDEPTAPRYAERLLELAGRSRSR
jgi:uncharacterized protein YecE (DUF72 family)